MRDYSQSEKSRTTMSGFTHRAGAINRKLFEAGNPTTCGESTIRVPFAFQGERLSMQFDAFEGEITGHVGRDGDPDSEVKLSRTCDPMDSEVPSFGIREGYATIHEMWISTSELPISFVPGDLNADDVLGLDDIDALTEATLTNIEDPRFDLNDDRIVDDKDRHEWVTNLRQTWFGDGNLDGEFNSGDLVDVFQFGHYEDAIAMNSGWAEGDWDGDGDFASGDLVVAFADGGFEKGLRPEMNAVPEPTSIAMLMAALIGFAKVSRSRRERV